MEASQDQEQKLVHGQEYFGAPARPFQFKPCRFGHGDLMKIFRNLLRLLVQQNSRQVALTSILSTKPWLKSQQSYTRPKSHCTQDQVSLHTPPPLTLCALAHTGYAEKLIHSSRVTILSPKIALHTSSTKTHCVHKALLQADSLHPPTYPSPPCPILSPTPTPVLPYG